MRSSPLLAAAASATILLCCCTAAAGTDTANSVEIRLIPVSTTAEDGMVTMTAKVRVVNKLSAPVSNVVGVASHPHTIQVTPGTVTVDYIHPKTAVLAEGTVTVVFPEPTQDEADPADTLEWAVDYAVAGDDPGSGAASAGGSDELSRGRPEKSARAPREAARPSPGRPPRAQA